VQAGIFTRDPNFFCASRHGLNAAPAFRFGAPRIAPRPLERLTTASAIASTAMTNSTALERVITWGEPHYRILTGRRPPLVMTKPQLCANTEHRPPDRLVPYEYNARTHGSAPLEQMASSLKLCGFTFTGRRATRAADGLPFSTDERGGRQL
jgi:hypothetical protein